MKNLSSLVWRFCSGDDNPVTATSPNCIFVLIEVMMMHWWWLVKCRFLPCLASLGCNWCSSRGLLGSYRWCFINVACFVDDVKYPFVLYQFYFIHYPSLVRAHFFFVFWFQSGPPMMWVFFNLWYSTRYLEYMYHHIVDLQHKLRLIHGSSLKLMHFIHENLFVISGVRLSLFNYFGWCWDNSQGITAEKNFIFCFGFVICVHIYFNM